MKCPAQTSVLGPGDSFVCDVDVGGKGAESEDESEQGQTGHAGKVS